MSLLVLYKVYAFGTFKYLINKYLYIDPLSSAKPIVHAYNNFFKAAFFHFDFGKTKQTILSQYLFNWLFFKCSEFKRYILFYKPHNILLFIFHFVN